MNSQQEDDIDQKPRSKADTKRLELQRFGHYLRPSERGMLRMFAMQGWTIRVQGRPTVGGVRTSQPLDVVGRRDAEKILVVRAR